MAKTKYNLNELLERKKELEVQIQESIKVNSQDLVYEHQIIVDANDTKNKREVETRKQISLNDYTIKVNEMLKELSKIKTAIIKFNSENTIELLNNREIVREKILYLKTIKLNLKKDKQEGRKVTRTNNEGVALEYVDFTIKPMFEMEEVEKQLNQASAEERKLNTQIQKINLNAQIEL